MLTDPPELIVLPPSPGDAGMVHGRDIADLLRPAFVEHYIARLRAAIAFEIDDLHEQAASWLAGLPSHVREEIDGMAVGAGVSVETVGIFLFADIARGARGTASRAITRPVGGSVENMDDEAAAPAGPMCSALVARTDDGDRWVARNCDWLTATLVRGTSAVVHRTPGRIPIMAVGIRGDIDVDTGINAEGLWLHLHTMHATDRAPDDRPVISWLFWAREALETCSSLDDLEAFCRATGRDRGVLAIAVEGRTGEAAVFECGRGSCVRHGCDPSGVACVTNHSPSKRVPPAIEGGNAGGLPGGTFSRYHALSGLSGERPPREGPGDLVSLLGAEGVEMRTPTHIRTIYSAVCAPSRNEVWFAGGGADGTPAASRGRWTRLRAPW